MAFCKQCGTQLTPTNRFCPKCGAPTGQNPTTGNSAQGTYAPPKKAEVNFSEIGSKIADTGAKIITNISERASGAGATTLQKPTGGFPLLYAALAGMVATLVLSFTKILNFGFYFNDYEEFEYYDIGIEFGHVTLKKMIKFIDEYEEINFEGFIYGIFNVVSTLGVILMLVGIVVLMLPKLLKKSASAINTVIPIMSLIFFILIQRIASIACSYYSGENFNELLYTNELGTVFYGIAFSTFFILVALAKENKWNNPKKPHNALKAPDRFKVSLPSSCKYLFWGCFGLIVITYIFNLLPAYKINFDDNSMSQYFYSMLQYLLPLEDADPNLTAPKLVEIHTILLRITDYLQDPLDGHISSYLDSTVFGEFFLRIGPVITIIGAVKMLVSKLSKKKFGGSEAIITAIGVFLTVVNKLIILAFTWLCIEGIKQSIEENLGLNADDINKILEDSEEFGKIAPEFTVFLIISAVAIVGLIILFSKILSEKSKFRKELQASYQNPANQVPYQDAYGAAQPAQDFSSTIQ